LVKRNPGGRRRREEELPGDGFVVPFRDSSPIDPRVNLPLSKRKVTVEQRGAITVTTYVDPPLTSEPEQESFPLPLPEEPFKPVRGRTIGEAKR
jgi:hypothetical protein